MTTAAAPSRRPVPVMAAEMAEQPAVASCLLHRRRTIRADIRAVTPTPLRGIALVGRGSSGHVAAFGRHLLETVTGLPATTVPPSVLASARSGSPYAGFLAFGISQSGETADVAAALEALRRAGARTVAVTANPRSPLGNHAHLVLHLPTGPEQAVPATKTLTASLLALLLAAEALGSVGWTSVELERLPGVLTGVLADTGPAFAAAARLGRHDRWGCVGGGLLGPIAAEAALKLEEIALVVADHHTSASFRHGPIATAGPRRPVLTLVSGADDTTTAGVVEALRAAGSPLVVAAPDSGADLILPTLPAPLVAIPAVVRAQQLALALAERRHLDPDHPPGLSKVTP